MSNHAFESLDAARNGLPTLVLPDGRKVDRAHAEWRRFDVRWRWLLDSYEGGDQYRQAVYGRDPKGMPVRNLVRHKREYPDPMDPNVLGPAGRAIGTDPAAQATDDDYELRRARTPVPTFAREAIVEHVGKIYDQEVKRSGPPAIEAWWEDVDGRGDSMDQWMSSTGAPLLMLFGQLDFIVERPPAPEGEEVRTRADEIRLGLDRAIVNYILPGNVRWWTLDRGGRYVECVVAEHDDDGGCRYRYWTGAGWTLYDDRGEVVGSGDHGYGAVPIVRCFDRRRPSCRHVGLPHYETIAELQREFYNRDSELILSDTTQAHPLLQGPEDYIKADGTIPIGPNWLLPKKKNAHGASAAYEGFDVVPFPKDGAESIRRNKHDLRDMSDRAANLTKPAGASGSTGQTVSQSGVSKQLDQSTGNKLLGQKAAVLEKAERAVAELAAAVLGVAVGPDAIKVQYPRQFNLYDATELVEAIQGYQLVLGQAGATPETEGVLLSRLVRLMLPGADDAEYARYDEEIAARLAAAGESLRRESAAAPDDAGPDEPDDRAADDAAADDANQPEGA